MQVKNDTVQGTIVLNLKYQANGEPVLAGLKRVSKPGLRILQPTARICPVS